MISLELAKELKEAGLIWEPQVGDMFYWHNYSAHCMCEFIADTPEETAASALLWILEGRG